MDLDNILDENAAAPSEGGATTPAASVTSSTSIAPEAVREMSAQAIGRMMGLASVSDLKLLEGKVDLMASKMTSFGLKIDKVVSVMSTVPTGADLERIDVKIGSLRNMLKDLSVAIEALQPALSKAKGGAEGEEGQKKSSVFVKPA